MEQDSKVLVKKRGGWLTFLFWYLALANVYGILAALLTSPSQYAAGEALLHISINPVSIYAGIVFDIVTIVAAVLLLYWRRVGFYIYSGGVLLRIISSFILNGFSWVTILGAILDIAFPVIVYFSMRSRWKLFT